MTQMLSAEDEKLCRKRAMEQWEKSLTRPDLDERSRVMGAVDAALRQALAISIVPAMTSEPETLAAELEGLCIDWNGEPIVDASTPRVDPEVSLLRRAATLIRSQASTISVQRQNFHDMQHAANELRKRAEAAEKEIQALREALDQIKEAILSPINKGAITDTVWMPEKPYPIETLIDYIDFARARSG